MVFGDEWELDPRELKFSTPLGQGAFGKVVTGYYCDRKVAIKLVKGRVNTFHFMFSSLAFLFTQIECFAREGLYLAGGLLLTLAYSGGRTCLVLRGASTASSVR